MDLAAHITLTIRLSPSKFGAVLTTKRISNARLLWRCSLFFCVASVSNAPAATSSPTLTSIFAFPAGQNPVSGVIQGTNGHFYATTPTGGTNNLGAVCEITPAGTLVNMISFDGTNGSAPLAPLLQARDGNFYGTTSKGGSSGNGAVFKISPSGKLSVIASFHGTNETAPYGGLIEGTNGDFYGTTSGGTNNSGTVFQVTPGGVMTNLVLFDGTNGSNPYAGLVDDEGAFYGTTQYGGANGLGTFFQIISNDVLTTMVSFDGASGAFPKGLAFGRDRNFYGVTISGGANGLGTIFKVTPSGTLASLLEFGGTNGSNPNASLLLAADGNFYGTTQQGGSNGVGTVFEVNTNGILISLASFTWANGAYPQGSLIQGTDGNLYGTASGGDKYGAGNVFKISGFAPSILSQPASQTVSAGVRAVFKVSATGSFPLFFLWQKNGTNLSDGGNISGSQTGSSTVSGAASPDAGTYSVYVYNGSGAVLSSNAILKIITQLVVTITAPPANTRTNALTVIGTAVDNINITTIFCWFTNINNGAITVTTNNFTPTGTNLAKFSWTNTPALPPGTNIMAVQGIDVLNNVSPIVTRSFFIKSPAILSLTQSGNGSGTVSGKASVLNDMPPTNNAVLNIGEGYTLTAVHDKNSLFTNWTGSIATSTNPTLNFIMESGTTIQANFVTNLFIGMAGIYNGLFYATHAITPETAGSLVNFNVEMSGAYSGDIDLNGVVYYLSGGFNTSGHATNRVVRPASAGGDVTVSLLLNWNQSPRQVLGIVSGTNEEGWSAALVAEAAGKNTSAIKYTMLIPPGTNPPAIFPPGNGYGLLTCHAADVTITGSLADGTSYSETVAVSETGDVPIYASLYRNTGLLLGWINLDGGAPAGNLTWIKQPSAVTLLYTNGFTNSVAVEGSTWSAPAPNLTQLDISGGGLSTPLDFQVMIGGNILKKLANSAPTNSLTGSINPTTGLITLAFGNGNGRAVTTGFAAILQSSNAAGGFFTTRTNAGTIDLGP